MIRETQTLTVNDSAEAILNLGDASFAFPEGQYVLPEGQGCFKSMSWMCLWI